MPGLRGVVVVVVVGNSGQNVRSACVRILIITNTEIQNFKQIQPAHSRVEARHQISDTELHLYGQGELVRSDNYQDGTKFISEIISATPSLEQTSDTQTRFVIFGPQSFPEGWCWLVSVDTGRPSVLTMIKTINFLLILCSAPRAMASQARNILSWMEKLLSSVSLLWENISTTNTSTILSFVSSRLGNGQWYHWLNCRNYVMKIMIVPGLKGKDS